MPLEDAEGRVSGKGSARSTPFLDSFSFEADEAVTSAEANIQPVPPRLSPFLSVYETAGQPDYRDPEAEALAEFLSEIHDSEFDEALLEVVHEAEALVEDRFAAEVGDLRTQTRNIENLLQAHLAPLADEIEHMLDTLQRELEGRDPSTLDSSEVDAIVEGYVPSQRLSPAFENFGLGVLKKGRRRRPPRSRVASCSASSLLPSRSWRQSCSDRWYRSRSTSCRRSTSRSLARSPRNWG